MQTLNDQTDRVTLTNEVTSIFRQTLTRLGFCYRTADGDLWQVAFKDVGYYPPGDAAVLVVDVHRLPRKVATLALADKVVIHELSTAVGGYLVQAGNTTGLLYKASALSCVRRPVSPSSPHLYSATIPLALAGTCCVLLVHEVAYLA